MLCLCTVVFELMSTYQHAHSDDFNRQMSSIVFAMFNILFQHVSMLTSANKGNALLYLAFFNHPGGLTILLYFAQYKGFSIHIPFLYSLLHSFVESSLLSGQSMMAFYSLLFLNNRPLLCTQFWRAWNFRFMVNGRTVPSKEKKRKEKEEMNTAQKNQERLH